MSGSATVTQKFKNGVTLNSGHKLLWGKCTKSVPTEVGDLIFYDGYLKDGCINAILIAKIPL